MTRQIVALLGLGLLIPSMLEAQAAGSREEPLPWHIYPHIIIGTAAPRWKGFDRSDLPPLETAVGWAPQPMPGVALQFRSPGRYAVEIQGGVTQTDYAIDRADQNIRSVGKIRLARVAGGIQFRMRPDVPGFFSAGANAVYYQPVTQIGQLDQATGRIVPFYSDETQWMPGAYLGVGFDHSVPGDRAFRWEFRFSGTRASQSSLPVRQGSGGHLDARGVAVDLLFFAGLVLPLDRR